VKELQEEETEPGTGTTLKRKRGKKKPTQWRGRGEIKDNHHPSMGLKESLNIRRMRGRKKNRTSHRGGGFEKKYTRGKKEKVLTNTNGRGRGWQ